jgi:hypothetical protein
MIGRSGSCWREGGGCVSPENLVRKMRTFIMRAVDWGRDDFSAGSPGGVGRLAVELFHSLLNASTGLVIAARIA